MTQFSEHADVATSVEQAFDYVIDQAKVAEWNDHVKSVDVIGGSPVRVGTQLRQHRRRGNRDFDLTFEVTAHDRPSRHTVSGQVFGVDTTIDFTFTELGSGTRVTMTGTVTGRGVRSLLAPIVAREMRRSTLSALAALKQSLASAQ